jgi:exopolysaccharide production protein ExoQ
MPANSFAAKPLEKPPTLVKPTTPSYWMWIPYVWLFIVSTRSLSYWFGGIVVQEDMQADLSGSFLDRTILELLMLFGLLVLGLRADRTKRILGHNRWLVALFVYMGVTILWSNFPDISFRRWFRLVGTLIMVLVVQTERDPVGALRVLLRRLYLVHLPLSIITTKYFRNIGIQWSKDGSEQSWTGLTLHKNNLGQVAMCSGIVSTWQILQNWSRRKLTVDLVMLVLAAWGLRGPQASARSSTAIVGLIVTTVVLFALQRYKKRPDQLDRDIRAWAVIAVAMVALWPVFEAISTNPLEVAVRASGRDMTFTGRTGLWKDVIDNAAKNPVLGVGIGAFWVGPIGYALYPLNNWSRVTPGWRPQQGHNGYVDTYVDLGLIGVALVLIVIGSAFAGALVDLRNNFELGSLRLSLLVSIVLNNFTESSLLKGTHSLWFLFLLVAINVPTRTQEKVLRPKPALQFLHGIRTA